MFLQYLNVQSQLELAQKALASATSANSGTPSPNAALSRANSQSVTFADVSSPEKANSVSPHASRRDPTRRNR